MLRIKGIAHVAMAVPDLDAVLALLRDNLGIEARDREVVEDQHTEAAFVPIGDGALELISPRGNAGLERYLERRGAGLHHIAIEVEGLAEALERLREKGVPLIDERPRVGAHGHLVAFLHPKAAGGLLIELVEPHS